MSFQNCPCTSGKTYEECCAPFHRGALPKTALELMRSRYSAYALLLADYIMLTTHPKSPYFSKETASWKQEILSFSKETEFRKLEVLSFEEGETLATVTFKAHLFQQGKDVSFTEKSSFEKVQGKWLYLTGNP